MPGPTGVLMCRPDHYNVLEVKNPLMADRVGTVSPTVAKAQWEALRHGFEQAGMPVSLIEPVAGLEDMVFCANQTMLGLDARMRKVCLLGSMRHPSRRREVAAFESFFRGAGYDIVRLSRPGVFFEGAGDALWHPGRRLIWGGYGFRSDAEAYEEVSEVFDAPVVLLKLVNERYYHLDTCFCPLTPESVLIHAPAFDPESLGVILALFPTVIVADEREAERLLACNAAVLESGRAIIQSGAVNSAQRMRSMGLEVMETDTSEFIKSGGSVFCMKMFTYG